MHSLIRFILLLLILMTPLSSLATTNQCDKRPDGTDCNSDCVTGGKCFAEECQGGQARPDGTPCASGNFCTRNDFCHEGMCILGAPIVCRKIPCFDAICLRPSRAFDDSSFLSVCIHQF